ncbi:hypothetical protein PYCC9005_001589 [Savitreella phatthalungensis]
MWYRHLALFTFPFITLAQTLDPIVDVGYARYRGYIDTENKLAAFKGMRFAEKPERFRRAKQPAVDNTSASSLAIVDATEYSVFCPQARPDVPESSKNVPPVETIATDEDCLFLNVFFPQNAPVDAKLPVVVYIHGGGYGQGGGSTNSSYMRSVAEGDFVFVSIQYRLGVFGFLSSAEVAKDGDLNVGLLDQELALEWIQTHISKFGGDPSRVTIWGESAGAGSVMQHLLAYGGRPKSSGQMLFTQAIAASPYLPQQHAFDGPTPTARYQALLRATSCDSLECLRGLNTTVLAAAADKVAKLAPPSEFPFTPVTDGVFSIDRPTVQFKKGAIRSNVTILIGTNHNEGEVFIPETLSSDADFDGYVTALLPNIMGSIRETLLQKMYPAPDTPAGKRLYSDQKGRAALLYGDTVFVCPANWLVGAAVEGLSHRYRYDVVPALHGRDVLHYLPDASFVPFTPPPSWRPFDAVFAGTFINFALTGIPTIPASQPKTITPWNSSTQTLTAFNVTDTAAASWEPVVTEASAAVLTDGVDRCEFWREHGALVPE